VFGADDRVPLPAKHKALQEKLGLLFNPRSRMVCTAFCVAPDIVATAGHCLFRIAGERPPRIGDFWFARNYDAVRDYARVAGHTTGSTAQHVMSGAATLNMRPPIDAARDWAFVRLARASCSKGVLPVRPLPTEEIIAAAAEKRVFQVSYHRDFTPWRLAYASPCSIDRAFAKTEWKSIAQDFTDAEALLLHTCDTGGASSGSPILLETPRGPEVIGINVGTYVQSKVEMMDGQVTRRFKAETVANTGVSAAAFAAKLDAFRQAVILATPAQIRDLQAVLLVQQLYAGPVDGTYGAVLRDAIEAYEKAQGLPVTGLATQALLKRLGGGAAGKTKARAKS
jgi:protease YdgD